MRKRWIACVCLFSLIVLSECAAADPLKIASLSYPPFQYEEKGEAKGIAADIVKAVFTRMNREITINFLPFPRAITYIKDGRSDVIFTFYYKKEREAFADYSREALVDQTISLFVHKDSKIVFDGNFSKLDPYKFGLVRFSYGKVFDDAVKNKEINRIDYVTEMETNMKKFIHRRFDILPSDRWVAYYYHSKIAPRGITRIKELKPSIQTFPAYIGFSKANKLSTLRDQVDQVLREMKTDGSYQKIIDAHVSQWGIDLN